MSSKRDPRKPTKAQERAEQRLRDLGAEVTFSPSRFVPHDHPEPVAGCFRCELIESAKRVNGPAVEVLSPGVQDGAR